ncbi:MAG: helix-turn-helix domain-containing protein [Candidatus Peregrinibacteria bacterium]|nr:helix-turn-helix domain-containing protein [Candidatus Peregrinibacteria bacterium]
MQTEILLTTLGLSAKAAKVYVTLLQLGPATMTQLAKAAAFKRPTTYLLVDELLMRGFVTATKNGKRTTYAAEHPRRLLQAMRTREHEMERVLPELEALYYEPKGRPRVGVYEGLQGTMQLYDELYESITTKREEALFFTAIGDLEERHPEILERFYATLNTLPRDYRMRELNHGDERAVTYAKNVRPRTGKNHHIRILDTKRFPFANTDMLIIGNKIMMFSLKDDLVAIVIENTQLANSQRALFNAAWEAGTEV